MYLPRLLLFVISTTQTTIHGNNISNNVSSHRDYRLKYRLKSQILRPGVLAGASLLQGDHKQGDHIERDATLPEEAVEEAPDALHLALLVGQPGCQGRMEAGQAGNKHIQHLGGEEINVFRRTS